MNCVIQKTSLAWVLILTGANLWGCPFAHSGKVRQSIACVVAIVQKKPLPHYKLIGPEQMHDSVGNAAASALPQKFTFLNWNLAKGKNEGIPKDLSKLTKQADLITVQETGFYPGEANEDLFPHQEDLEWHVASSSQNQEGRKTGVAIASRARALKVRPDASHAKEPFTLTSKMRMFNTYAIEGKNSHILVVSVHMINYNKNSIFRAELKSIVERISRHQGPVILAGDFNTWTPGRKKALLDETQKLGLESADSSRGWHADWTFLDGTFVRGLKVESDTIPRGIRSSDHKPHLYQFSVLKDVP